jgi:polyhydroxyalkanoate synthesis regulator phasin
MAAPLWRQAFDVAERTLAGPAEAAVRSELFNDALAAGVPARRRAQLEIERRTRRLLHTANVPTATDVRLLSEQVASLQREVRRLRREQESEREA